MRVGVQLFHVPMPISPLLCALCVVVKESPSFGGRPVWTEGGLIAQAGAHEVALAAHGSDL
jgi:hypothetical protein